MAIPDLNKPVKGFTLIELSIVLVIIGLIVGGVLVGQDLIRAAEIRATITQIEKFNTAKNTFYGKYGALPGDMSNAVALQFGFTSRAGTSGLGDGNGLIDSEGLSYYGEQGMFWSDLTYANGMNLNLIEGSFGASPSAPNFFTFTGAVTGTSFGLSFPAAKLGRGNYFYVYTNSVVNFFGITYGGGTTPYAIGTVVGGIFTAGPALSVLQAYTIDKKIDDGLPTSGSTQVNYINPNFLQSNPAGSGGYTSSTCYNSTTNTYAIDSSINGNGAAGLCALSFRFQ